jgi:hypothetical protein
MTNVRSTDLQTLRLKGIQKVGALEMFAAMHSFVGGATSALHLTTAGQGSKSMEQCDELPG